MNRSFEEDLDKLRSRLIRMGSLVEEQVEFSFRALKEGNLELARIVTERDEKVNKLDLKIDKQCQRIFALNQPVAVDLRLLLTAIKINNELELIGDIATEIAQAVIDTPAVTELSRTIDIEPLTNAVYTMVKSSMDAFITNDPELALHILPSDDTVDALYLQKRATLIDIMTSDQATVAAGAELLLSLQDMEHMADHASNIAENVIFLVRAQLVRHQSFEGETGTA
ncbi:MAG: phosphate transport system regulatory protein PhoU [Chlorobi bacterium]|nr:MAG: phosphate signaling complex protein PhoU [Bacteroidota bacterium]KXK34092.1 MAG: phosphate transport system protein [Chlorobi bacterium OLB6]MBE2266570.1 phosphate signaling complex protein PhoU [Flavobacteriales bacterium]MBL1161375.1 phosphate transport system regulatory protein PhoU [Chlorobiota bacterium]MBW7852662.1 phosphate signaling complex protein PhoU [Candidatus Kapabacteria bacterium]MCC6331078.1 phosphate signaling complex protein PhoU [Ignavibacteria bacterium]